MSSSTSIRFADISSRVTLGLASAGGVAVVGLIPLTAVVGEWWLLAATFSLLLTTAGLVVLGFFGLLSETGDTMSQAATGTKQLARSGRNAAAERGLRPALGSL